MGNHQIFITHSPEETQQRAASFAHSVKIPSIICLYGNLGTGKTTFVQGFAQGLGIQERITSPSFLRMKQYKLPQGEVFYHIDLYKGLFEGIEEILSAKDSIILIEWAEALNHRLPPKRIDVRFDYDNEMRRTITIVEISINTSS
ncbi:MAG: tRNA (adenosine(37)-N6)-threonylcarbamoyltransferase complex ATPase subunit type 1 TsaE [Patescibacteria group bacterium]|nr:tRNA (adenosine(37)-N6)-threonylcarbamoyltransferase complex ATPase subunit type 1 TsaE [Patescibacteria group bacterium]